MRTNPATDRLRAAEKLAIAMALVLMPPCLATVWSLGQQKPVQSPKSRVQIQNKSPVEKKIPGPVDGGKTVYLPPKPPQTPAPQTPPKQEPPPQTPLPPTPPRQGPPLQLAFIPQRVRVGEQVTFIVRLPVQRRDLVQGVPPLAINFDDGTPEEQVEINSPGVAHRFAVARSYDVRVYFGDLKSRKYQPAPVSNTVTVQVDPWSFTPSAAQVGVGEQVTLKIDNPPADSNISYRFHFGEDSQAADWSAKADAPYRYHSGGKFSPHVDIQVTDGSRQIAASTEPREIVVQALPRTALLLDVQPPSIQAGREISFTATLSSKFETTDQSIWFNFFYGDEKSSDWQRERTARHSYSSAGDYKAHVVVGWRNAQSNEYREITSSVDHLINVAAIPQEPGRPSNNNQSRPPVGGPLDGGPDLPPYLIYILTGLVVIALALLVASYKTWKGRLSIRPEYVAQADSGSAQTNDGRLTLDFELHFTPNEQEVHYQIDASEAGLIRFERRTHD
jgi:hypothetical protein